jgi:DNA-binding MarR family transcriptional regulator
VTPPSPTPRAAGGAPDGFDGAANRLGALARVLTDRSDDAMAATGHAAGSAAAALSSLHHFLDAPSIDLLRQVLGLTPSGAVRLVDRLEAAGQVRRAAGADGRTVALELTPRGRRAAAAVAGARGRVLADALGALSPQERAVLDGLVGRLLVGRLRAPGSTRWICRLCDTTVCGRLAGDCPLATASGAVPPKGSPATPSGMRAGPSPGVQHG